MHDNKNFRIRLRRDESAIAKCFKTFSYFGYTFAVYESIKTNSKLYEVAEFRTGCSAHPSAFKSISEAIEETKKHIKERFEQKGEPIAPPLFINLYT